jgi:hypothetical protein
LPQAEQLARLAVTPRRHADGLPPGRAPILPDRLGAAAHPPPRSIDDGTMPASVSTCDPGAHQPTTTRRAPRDPRRIDAFAKPRGARRMAARRSRGAITSRTATRRSGASSDDCPADGQRLVGRPEGDWTMGLGRVAARRLRAVEARSSAPLRHRPIRAACRVVLLGLPRGAALPRARASSNAYMRYAAGRRRTLYGMLAAEQLGIALPARSADFSSADWRRVGGTTTSASPSRSPRSAATAGERSAAAPGAHRRSRRLTRRCRGCARELGLPATQLYMAHNAPSGGAPIRPRSTRARNGCR